MLLDFFNTVANLKKIPRQGWIDALGMKNPESVSDHTFSMTMMCMVFSEMQNLDTLRVLKMSLLHDLAESNTGDLTPNQISKAEKLILEKNTISKILKSLPINLEKSYNELWDELCENTSPESKLVHEIDKLEMALQAKIYEKNGHVNIESFLNSAESEIQNPELKELFKKIITQ